MAKRALRRKQILSKKVSKESLSSKDLHEKIQKKAYELYEKRGVTHGNDWADWFEAEKLVKSGKC